jgi:hypothetical protein
MTTIERRLQRIASTMNARARKYRAPGVMDWRQLVLVAERDNHRCHYCQAILLLDGGSWDHVIAFDKGGDNWSTNIVRCCYRCQRAKHTKNAEEYLVHQQLLVTCARPGCGNTYKPRWAEYKRGMARFCSHQCAGTAKGKGW